MHIQQGQQCCNVDVQSVQKKRDQNVFFVIRGRFWWNLIYHILNKFPPHLNNVSTLPCETWNAHRTVQPLGCYRKKLQKAIPPQLHVTTKFAGFESVCGSHSSMASLIAPDQWCVFCTPSLAIFLAWYYQLDSKLAKLEDTVEVG